MVDDNNKYGNETSLNATTKGPSIMSMDSDFGRPQSISNTRYGGSSNTANSSGTSSAKNASSSYSNGGSDGDASKRFANAKSISSDQYFGRSGLNEVFFPNAATLTYRSIYLLS